MRGPMRGKRGQMRGRPMRGERGRRREVANERGGGRGEGDGGHNGNNTIK
jgi:hypothetical protein